ncbi:MAG TPA: hypothetical protein VM260_07790 [Pirellula sp.]|nr:hypothetical protein [Pirellula sp.]
MGNECPVARSYAQRLEATAKQYADRSVPFVGINSNQHDSEVELRQFVKDKIDLAEALAANCYIGCLR